METTFGQLGKSSWNFLVIAAAFAVVCALLVFLQPYIMSRAVELHPALVLTALTIGGLVGGLSGVFLAVPVAACLKSVLIYVHELDPNAPSGAIEPPHLKHSSS